MKQNLLVCFLLLFALLSIAHAQEKIITGKVTDQSDGSPIAGASVLVPNTTIGTQSDGQGRYSFKVPANASAIVVRYIGYLSKTVSLEGKNVIDVSLSSDASELSEVVVTGYGTQRREDVTGSISSVKGEAVAQLPIQSFESALGGRMAGVQITVPNGVLNNPPVFRIRGTNSISLSSYPLVVVDGVPTYSGDVGGSNAPTNPLASINPSDIASIDVAKDAAATAIYGSRAANGVVFITTKQGQIGTTKINYDSWVGITKAYRLPELLNAQDYITWKTLGVSNNPTANVQYVQTNDANGNPKETDWRDVVYRTAVSHNHNLNISGGTEKTKYYFSTGYSDQEGIVRKNDFQRLNGLFNVNSKLKDYLTVGGKLSYSNEKNKSAGSSGSLEGESFSTAGLGRLAIVLPPILSPFNNDGSYAINNAAIGSAENIIGIGNLSYYNPQVILDLNRSNTENNHVQGNAYIQINPWEWLTLKSSYGIDYLFADDDIFLTPLSGEGYSSTGSVTGRFDKRKTWMLTNTAQFQYTFGERHNVSALAGQEQQRYTRRRFGINRTTLSDQDYTELQAGWVNNNPSGMDLGENYLLSVFGSVNYNFDEKYYLTANIRQDEHSALGEKKGTFWGASLGWEITKENFWQSSSLSNIFSSFKIRGSYGKVGNIGGIDDYASYSLYGSGLYGGLSSLYFDKVGNPILRWETSKKTDIGFNFGLMDNRLTGEFAYYKNDIDNLILRVDQAPSTGLPSADDKKPQQNVGTMYNKGIEFALNYAAINTPKFQWNTSFNFTYNKNEVTSLAPGLNDIPTSTSGLETVNLTMPGYSLGYLWVVRTDGVDPATGKRIFLDGQGNRVYYQYYAPNNQYNYSTTPDGTTQYVSATGATAISSAADAVMYANSVPKFYGGWDNSFRIGNFDLNVLLTYQLGFHVYYGTNSGLHDQRWWNNSSDVLTDAWTTQGDENKIYARPVYGDNVSNGSSMPLDINVFKGDFLKLKNVTLGYTFPSSMLQRAGISSLRLYVSGQNLAIITSYPGPDPEVSSNGLNNNAQGVDRNTVGNGRTFTLGLNIGL
jgi:TonB-dependent starch-binding outer membrane protein SusC